MYVPLFDCPHNIPDHGSLQNATNLVKQAIEHDQNNNYEEAYRVSLIYHGNLVKRWMIITNSFIKMLWIILI